MKTRFGGAREFVREAMEKRARMMQRGVAMRWRGWLVEDSGL